MIITSVFAPYYSPGSPADQALADLAFWKAAGVESIVISDQQDSSTVAFYISQARLVGMKVILTTLMPYPINWQLKRARLALFKTTQGDWLSQLHALANTYAKYSPDAWYLNFEVGIDGPVINVGGNWVSAADPYIKAIAIIRAIKDVPIYISPYYITWGTFPTDDSVRNNWGQFVAQVAQGAPGAKIISSLQDGVGCDYNNPRRIVGSSSHADFLSKAKIHKQVCEQYGWRATVNTELFDTYPQSSTPTSPTIANPATPDRVKAQIETEGTSDTVSAGLGLGPAYAGDGILPRTYDSAWYPNHVDVYGMELKRFSGN